VAELHGDGVRVRQACYTLDVSPSGYCDWKTRAPSARPVRHAWLTGLIGQVHDASCGTYGQPRVSAELRSTHGLVTGHNTVMLLMRRAGLSGLPLRRRAKKVPAQKTVTDLARRQFTADGPNRLWVTDITEHPTREGKAYCCVGWATGTAQRADLATNALGMATGSRRPSPGAVIHGDHGTRFTSWALTTRAKGAGLLPSLGTVGDPYGNAVVESFWGRMQAGLLNRQRWRTRVELANAIFEYIEGFCNRRRRHSALGWASPLEFETEHRNRAPTPHDPLR
jgi:transposase InsO family protein